MHFCTDARKPRRGLFCRRSYRARISRFRASPRPSRAPPAGGPRAARCSQSGCIARQTETAGRPPQSGRSCSDCHTVTQQVKCPSTWHPWLGQAPGAPVQQPLAWPFDLATASNAQPRSTPSSSGRGGTVTFFPRQHLRQRRTPLPGSGRRRPVGTPFSPHRPRPFHLGEVVLQRWHTPGRPPTSSRTLALLQRRSGCRS